jgi:hypothetical protein
MAGFYKMYMVEGLGVFLVEDGISPISFQILKGT